jgi:group I intron endonuclease
VGGGMTACSVYWVHHPDHSNMLTQGYIGVSKNVKTRFSSHKNSPSNEHLKRAIKKYGWDTLVKKVLLIADEAYCLMIEAKLRATDKIGWNVVAGGGKPPNALGKKFIRSEEYKLKQSLSHKGKASWNKGLIYTEEQKNKIFNLAEHMKDKIHPMQGKKHRPESIEKTRQAKLGIVMPEEIKQKLSLANKGRKYEQITCPKCNTIGGATGMKKWHFDNCTGARLFKARTTINGKRIWLGKFATKEQADIAVKNAQLGAQNG